MCPPLFDERKLTQIVGDDCELEEWDPLHSSDRLRVPAGPSGHIPAAGFIHTVSQMWPSGSSKLRPYMKPRS
jgi:hypothetical protein